MQDGKLLLAQRMVREGSLSWQFPAGEVDAGESPEQAAARETGEEVGLTVHATKLLGDRVHRTTGRRMAYVACDIDSGDALVTNTDELAAVAWSALRKRRITSRTASNPRSKIIDSQGFKC